MRRFEERIGRSAPLTHVDVLDGVHGSEPTRSDRAMFEKTEQNAIVH